MLNWRIDKIRYAPDKVTFVLVNPDTKEKKELHVSLEEYKNILSAVVRVDDEMIWFSKIVRKHFDLPE